MDSTEVICGLYIWMFGESGRRSLLEIRSIPASSAPPVGDHFLDLRDGLARIESLWTGPGAVENGVAPIEPERVLELVEPLAGRLVSAVGQPAPGLQKHGGTRSEEHTSELQSLMRISYAVFCLKKKIM